jgi:protein TonB
MNRFRFLNYLIAGCLFLIAQTGFSQNKADAFYALDKDYQVIENIKKAVYLLRVKNLADSSWRMDIYNMWGPLVQAIHYKDREGTIKNGKKYLYNSKGLLVVEENYQDGQLHGKSYYRNDSGKVTMSKEYENGNLVKSIDYLKDSLPKIPKDSAKDLTEKEASFEGGIRAWSAFLQKNFEYPKRAMDSNIQGTVNVGFIVNKEGKIEEVHLFKSVELSLDDETIRLIQKAPSWSPAVQKGRIVKSYMKQPVIFKLN